MLRDGSAATLAPAAVYLLNRRRDTSTASPRACSGKAFLLCAQFSAKLSESRRHSSASYMRPSTKSSCSSASHAAHLHVSSLLALHHHIQLPLADKMAHPSPAYAK